MFLAGFYNLFVFETEFVAIPNLSAAEFGVQTGEFAVMPGA